MTTFPYTLLFQIEYSVHPIALYREPPLKYTQRSQHKTGHGPIVKKATADEMELNAAGRQEVKTKASIVKGKEAITWQTAQP
jgi:hypothetical protein